MVSGSSVPPPVASPRMRAAPRRKRGRTGAVLRTAAPEGQEPGSGTAARLAALQLSWEVEDVAVKEEAQLFVQQQSSFLIAVALLHSPHP
ncbi:uncharacterized protein LOC124417573 isoform X5 [Gallus gallus]|uniref:uncharacterized protein LOC124417573 isoform X5 n=1 Tax=Gallus gallus TaxID=9031 RepID=UPI001EFFA77F|nr:uncharacterized protein LOC124417573 isoform X5 [Gallus gallus]